VLSKEMLLTHPLHLCKLIQGKERAVQHTQQSC
jgi:hypothetical protein